LLLGSYHEREIGNILGWLRPRACPMVKRRRRAATRKHHYGFL